MSVTYGGDKITFDDGSSIASGYTNFRNRIINGDMRIDQRNAGASVTLDGSGVYPVDRWRCDEASDGAATGQQVSDAPAGFINSLRITTTTADASLTTNQYMGINQFIEGFYFADLGYGTASAKTFTLSFWVKSSLTGTFAGGVDNNAGDRTYVFNYTISAANTWEYKTITIAGDTSGTWATGNTRGLGLRFGLGAGTGLEGTVGTWQTGSKLSSSGAVSIIGTLNATWQITGVQLEVGSFATTFERRPHGLELQLCQRYYYRLVSASFDPICTAAGYNSTISFGVVLFPITMRTAPDIDQTAFSNQFSMAGNGTSTTFTSFAYNERGTDSITLYNNNSLSVTQGYAYWFRSAGAVSGQRLAFTAEL